MKYHKPQCKPQSAKWRQIRTVLNIEPGSWSARRTDEYAKHRAYMYFEEVVMEILFN